MIMTDASVVNPGGSDIFFSSQEDNCTARAMRAQQAVMGIDPSRTRQVCEGKYNSIANRLRSLAAYPLTAPTVAPCTKYFCTKG